MNSTVKQEIFFKKLANGVNQTLANGSAYNTRKMSQKKV